MGNPFEGWKIRHYPNPYRNAQKAFDAWNAKQLWGNPIILGQPPFSKIHVYGIYLRNWTRVMVEFTNFSITVVKPKQSPTAASGDRANG